MLFVPTAIDAGHYIYFYLENLGYPVLDFRPWLAPGMTVAEMQILLAPLFDKWAQLGISISPEYFTYDSFLAAYKVALPQEPVAGNTSKDASRLVPR